MSDITSSTLFTVGNGSSEKNRSNAFTINSNRTATVSADPINNMDVATKQYVDAIKAQLEAAIALKADK